MRIKLARTSYLAALGFSGLLGFTGSAFAQTPPANATTAVPAPAAPAAPVAPVKPTVETAATPVEQIKLNGRTLPLNIKTLAEVQRLNEEKELREKIQDALKTGGAVQIQASNVQPTSIAANATATGASTPVSATPKRARPVVPTNTLVAVYGPSNNLKAEVFVGKNDARELKTGDSFGKFRVAKISQTGIQLEPLSGGQSTKFVSVGQSLTN